MSRGIFIFIKLMGLVLSALSYAQSPAEVTLRVNLYPIQTIEVNSSHGSTVELNYKTKADYKNGVSATEEDHLKIYSTGGYVVRVRSATPVLTSSVSNGANIEAGDITITASKGTTNGFDGFATKPVQLSTADGELISSVSGGVNRTFNIHYAAKGDEDKYVNKYQSAQNPTVYTTQVFYSIEPK